MRKHFVLGAIIALIPAAAAYADSTGAGSGLPSSWGQSGAMVSHQMRSPLKASKQSINHTNVTSTNATTSPSTSSSTAPSQSISVKVKGEMRIRETK